MATSEGNQALEVAARGKDVEGESFIGVREVALVGCPVSIMNPYYSRYPREKS